MKLEKNAAHTSFNENEICNNIGRGLLQIFSGEGAFVVFINDE